MSKITCMIVLGLSLLVGGCVTPDETEAESAQLAEGSQRECRSNKSTGSRMRNPVCMTMDQWAMFDAKEKAREDIRGEFFRRVGESSTMGQGASFPQNPGPGGR